VEFLLELRGAGLSDVLAVVVRWFGGTKLGKGGLARAYAAAAREALIGLPVARRVPTVRVALQVPYEKVGAVKRLIHPPEVELESESYAEAAQLVLSVHEERRDDLREALADLGIVV
jgi:putative IMPACT (imprinted ancient) family translation regulator